MAVTMEQEGENLRVMRITGILKKSEYDTVLRAETKKWDRQTRVKLLVLAEDFQGWEQNEEWGDISIFLTYGDQVDKIAIVGDPKWETDLVMFAAGGLRRAPVQFFPSKELASAREWLG